MKTCRRCVYFGKQKKTHFYTCYNSKSECFRKPLSPHGELPKACGSYEGKPEDPDLGSHIDYDKIEGMKFVESLRGVYPDSEFWIIGTDPNLDLYPDNFFDDKLSITCNFACIAFPNSTYFLSCHTRVARAIVDKLGSEYLSKCIFIALCRYKRDPRTNIWWKDFGLDPMYARSLKKHMSKQTDEDRERMIGQLSAEGSFELVANRASGHAIQVAALLGAKKIILAGSSFKGGEVYYHAQGRGMSEFYKEKECWEPSEFEMLRAGQHRAIVATKQEIMMLVRLFKKHSIEIMKHRFDEKKGKFVFEQAESAPRFWGLPPSSPPEAPYWEREE